MRRVLLFILVAAAALAAFAVSRRHEDRALPDGATADMVLIEKGARRLTLMRAGNVLKAYPVSLGSNPVGHKQEEGDGRTPEGTYRIDLHKRDSAYHRALRISYPNVQDIRAARSRGVSPGGDIMIHGLPNGRSAIGRAHLASDWTAGCVAVTNEEIEEIWRAVADGTPVRIVP